MKLLFYALAIAWTQNAKNAAAIALGWSMAPAILWVNKYIFSDWQFVILMSIVVICDTALGIAIAWKAGRISSASFSRVFTKLIVYFVLLVAAHAASTYTVNGAANDLLGWVDGVVYASIMARELLSVLEKIGLLGYALPAGLMKRLDLFDENGKPK